MLCPRIEVQSGNLLSPNYVKAAISHFFQSTDYSQMSLEEELADDN